MHILLIASPSRINAYRRHMLFHQNTVHAATSLATALHYLRDYMPDVILMAYNQPDATALEALKAIRKVTTAALIITEATANKRQLPSAEIASLFDAGADDILPALRFNTIMPRLRAMVRRYRINAGDSILQAGSIRLHMDSYEVEIGGKTQKLNPKPHALLQCLVLAQGRPVTREKILYAIGSAESENRMIDVHVSGLRTKLGIKIECLHRQGYRLST